MPDLATQAGEPTGAIRGVISMIRKLAKDYPGSPVAVVFDAPGKTFRDDMYSEYKANRSSMPDELREQIQPIHDLIRAMGLPLICIEGVEADDVIGTYATMATEQKRATVISTGDKDMAQLVSEHVTLVNTMTDTQMDRQGVVDKFGVTPEQIVDYLALMGDSVDNIPGVPKVGPKTAAKWLNEFGTLDELMQRADEIKGKIGENLRNALDQLPLSKALTQIKCDVSLPLSLEQLQPTEPDQVHLRDAFARLEFKSWLEALDSDDAAVQQPDAAQPVFHERDYHLVTTEQELQQWVEELRSAGEFAVDTETTSINYMQAELVGFSFASAPGRAAYVPVAHDYPGAPDQLSLDAALAMLKPLLEDPKLTKIGQNLKYDMSVLARYGVSFAGPLFDTMLESYVLNSTATRHNMDALAEFYLGRSTVHFEDIAGKGAKQLTFNQITLDVAADYAAEDADITLQLHQHLMPLLQAQPSLEQTFTQIDMPLVAILSAVERQGALVDGRLLKQHGAELAQRLQALTEEAWEQAGENFNLDSTKQLQAIFYDKLNLPVLKRPLVVSPLQQSRCWSTLPKTMNCQPPYYSTEDWQSLSPPIPISCRSTSMQTPGVSTPRIIRRLRPRVGCPRQTQICRTFPFAMLRDDVYGRPSLHRRKKSLWLRITPRSN